MAITPRILLTQPAPAAVAAVTLFGLSMLGTNAFHQLRTHEEVRTQTSACADASATHGPQATWSESQWLRHAYCFDRNDDPVGAGSVAQAGLLYYPRSEPLHNIAGHSLIETGSYREAARVLERGLVAVRHPTNGVLQNNLAWSYLWIGQGGSASARTLYLASLQKDPQVCETLHTGLMVEFERARNTVGIERAGALKSYQILRNRYASCEGREQTWDNLIETSGIAVLDLQIESMLGSDFRDRSTNETLRISADRLAQDYGIELVGPLCAKAIPMSDLRDDCMRALTDH